MNLIFDGNYFFYKTLFTFNGYSNSKKILGSKKDQEMFIRKVATDISHSIRMFEKPSRIIFTIDSRSWRKDIPIENGGYKTNRAKTDTTIDWDSFYQCMDDFAAAIEQKGFIISREKRAEGDDLMYLWANRLLNDGQDSVIVTGDGDAVQCIRLENDNFIIIYNPNSKNRKLIAPHGFVEWSNKKTDEIDIFNLSEHINVNRDVITELTKKLTVEETDATYKIFEKIVIGDDGDTVPPIWSWIKNDKTYRITPAKAQLIYNDIVKTDNPIELPNYASEFSAAIEKHCKQKVSAEVLRSRLDRNIQLVYLDRNVIPSDIVQAFDNSYFNKIKTRIQIDTFDVNTLLGGTKYVKSNQYESDFFSNFS